METKTYTTIDRTALGWPSGPWDDEPDYMQWTDSSTGFPCAAIRHGKMGHWCGYVGIPSTNPFCSKAEDDLEVHGGITFEQYHLPDTIDNQDKTRWLGFDCAHAGDHCPANEKFMKEFNLSQDDNEMYKTLAYVQAECAKLANQLRKLHDDRKTD